MKPSPIASGALLMLVSAANGWGADWLTDGGDVVRSNWQKDEKLLSAATAKDIKRCGPSSSTTRCAPCTTCCRPW
jgi:hypothetical protein